MKQMKLESFLSANKNSSTPEKTVAYESHAAISMNDLNLILNVTKETAKRHRDRARRLKIMKKLGLISPEAK